MILSDRDLKAAIDQGRLRIDPLAPDALQPSSIDLRVGSQFRVFANHRYPHIDVRAPMDDLTDLIETAPDEPFILHPGEFVLGTTLEEVTLPNDLVGRLEGKSSTGRLGLLIHSSLPAGQRVLFRHDGRLEPRRIGDIVAKRLRGEVAAFDPVSLRVEYHAVTGWYEGPADRIFEIQTSTGRRVRVTGGHNVFTLDRHGDIRKVRTAELVAGTFVAIPARIPDPPAPVAEIDVLDVMPESARARFVVAGPAVVAAFEDQDDTLCGALRDAGYGHAHFYRRRGQLPVHVAAQFPPVMQALRRDGAVRPKGSSIGLPVRLTVTPAVAWLLGLYVAEGYRRHGQVVVSNTDQTILDRVEDVLSGLGLSAYRSAGAVTCCSTLLSALLAWLGTGGKAHTKRVPPAVFGWRRELIESFAAGYTDGDGSREDARVSWWTASDGLATDFLLLAQRLGRRAGMTTKHRGGGRLHQVYLPHNEHKLLTAVPRPDRLLSALRIQARLTLSELSQLAGFASCSSIGNLEQRSGHSAVRLRTLRRLRAALRYLPQAPASIGQLDRLVDGDLAWDRVVGVVDTGVTEPVYDLEVRPGGNHIENFVAGDGGIFVSNTAGFVDAGFHGHLTLELSNVANLPITIYPGMKIGQLCLFELTSPSDRPYGSAELGSKYQGQHGPTASRYHLNFEDQPPQQ